MNAAAGELLKNLFTSEAWEDHFTALSESLGFTLSLYSQTGRPIFVPESATHLCHAVGSTSPTFKSQCESYCLPLMMRTLQTGKPDVFKCYAGIMSFALPIDYLGEKSVILGQGSFSSYEDFREYMNLLNSSGLAAISVTTPLTFTSFQHAWKVCGYVADSLNRLLKNSQEAAALRKKIEGLKDIIGMWGAAADGPPESIYKNMIRRLASLLDLECIAVLAFDRKQGRYASLYSLSRSKAATEVISINEQDSIVKDLLSGKPFVLSAEPVQDPRADFLNDTGALYFFPIVVFQKLEGILRIADRVLAEGDVQIVTAFCKQTALSIENHRLHRELYRKFNQFAAVSELTKAISSIRNYEALLHTILDKSAELLKAEQGSLMLLDNETDDLLLEAKKGEVEGVSEKLRISRGEGIAGKVAELGEPMLVRNLEKDPRIKQKNRLHYKTRSFVSVPLKIDDRVIGVLNLSDKINGELFDEEDLSLVQSFATHAAVVLERNVFYNKSEELKMLTITDSLTGLLNRRYLYERLKDEVARSQRHGHHLSLLMLDLDGFKYCNDTFGHLFGDATLKDIAEALLGAVRSMDVVARYGGDEFMVILPETDEAVAIEIGERLRASVAKAVEFPRSAEEAGGALTASIGIVCYPEHADTIDLLLENADRALYRAKSKGKNRIEVFS